MRADVRTFWSRPRAKAMTLVHVALAVASLGIAAGLPAAALNLAPAPAERAPSPDRTDLALVLLVDMSGSIWKEERRFQRQTYIDVLSSPDIISALTSGHHGRSDVAYVEWSDTRNFHVIAPLTPVTDRQDMTRITGAIAHRAANDPDQKGATALGTALERAGQMLLSHDAFASRLVIDISADGRANEGTNADRIADDLAWHGITINGLPLIYLEPDDPDKDLMAYFETCVIRGPGHFMIPVRNRADLEASLRRKLLREIAGAPGAHQPARIQRASGPGETTSCAITDSPGTSRGSP